MHSKMPKLAVGLCALLITAGTIACNSKKEEKKEPGPDTTAVKAPPAPVVKDTTGGPIDTADTRPVKTPD